MKKKLYFGFASFIIVYFLVALHAVAENDDKTPSIEGTYKLLSRKLPDGTVQNPPDVIGLITFTKDFRNFNIIWKDKNGKRLSISSISNYELTPAEYTEKNIYYTVNDEIGGKEISYDLSDISGSSPVKIVEGRIEFQLPLHGEPSAVFEGDKFTATRQGEFIDFWEKVQ